VSPTIFESMSSGREPRVKRTRAAGPPVEDRGTPHEIEHVNGQVAVATGRREFPQSTRSLDPQGTQHDDTPLIVEDDVNNQALAMLAKGTCAHVRIGPLPVI